MRATPVQIGRPALGQEDPAWPQWQAVVDKHHARYVAALRALFEEHKRGAGYGNNVLIVE